VRTTLASDDPDPRLFAEPSVSLITSTVERSLPWFQLERDLVPLTRTLVGYDYEPREQAA
jgi:hypothetical protein